MEAHEKTIEKVGAKLEEVFAQLYIWFNELAEIRKYRPQDNGWTINEVLEHITLTNYYLLKVLNHSYPKAIKRATNKVTALIEESDLEILEAVGQIDSFTWTRPQHMEPKGEKPLSEILLLMKEQELKCMEILRKLKNGEGSFCKITMSVNSYGKIDLYQWLYFLALHSQRHLQQILGNKLEFLALGQGTAAKHNSK